MKTYLITYEVEVSGLFSSQLRYPSEIYAAKDLADLKKHIERELKEANDSFTVSAVLSKIETLK